jgi:hypothetical protein
MPRKGTYVRATKAPAKKKFVKAKKPLRIIRKTPKGPISKSAKSWTRKIRKMSGKAATKVARRRK